VARGFRSTTTGRRALSTWSGASAAKIPGRTVATSARAWREWGDDAAAEGGLVLQTRPASSSPISTQSPVSPKLQARRDAAAPDRGHARRRDQNDSRRVLFEWQ